MSKDNPYQGYHAQLLEKLERLECENAKLRDTVEQWKCRFYDVADAICRESTGIEDLCRQARALRAENAALRADKERLDFLGQTKCAYYYEGPCCWRINEDKDTDGDTLRAAIDAARKEAQP